MVDTLNFRKKDWDRGSFLISMGAFEQNESNIQDLSLKYFLRDCIKNEVRLVRIEPIEYEVIEQSRK